MPSNSIDFRWSVGAGTRRVECQTGHAEVIGTTGNITTCDVVLPSGGVACGQARTFITTSATRKRAICPWGHIQDVATADTSVCPTRICGGTRKAVASGPYIYDPANATLKSTIQAVLTWP